MTVSQCLYNSHKQHVVIDVLAVILGQDNETLTKQIYE
jgi:hypothetical protein